jgi:dihydroneopterin aldolase
VWSKSEVKELVKYVALYNECEGWPTHKHVPFWEKCAQAVAESSGMPLRSG